MKRSKLLKKIVRVLIIILSIAGSAFLFLLAMAFTTRPYYAHHWLGTGIENTCSEPQAIALFGAGGMPSGENMLRIYYAAEAWKQFPHCPVYICLSGDTAEEKGSLRMMMQELMVRGVEEGKIQFIAEGKNTRGQVLELAGLRNGKLKSDCLLVVTSPGHMRRCVLSLQKEDFNSLIPFPAFEIPLEGELRFDDQKLGGDRRFIAPSAGQTLTLRYEIWTQLNYQLICAREYVALAYYWVRGWI
jgi:uncharacterized SAM-binding protein YcdF (DUF218 family)